MIGRGLPLVAVCTPVYNGADHLEETMACVQAQTYPNVVHVISENSSTDATPEIIAKFAGAPKPVLASRTDALVPQMPNWNRAFALAPADARWHRILCADDLMTPDCIEKMVDAGESEPGVAMVSCVTDFGGALRDFLWPPGVTVVDGAEAIRRYFENTGIWIPPHVMIRSDLVRAHPRFFDESITLADADACLRTLLEGKFAFVNEHLAHFREHEGAFSTGAMGRWKVNYLDWLAYLDRYGPKVYDAEAFATLRKRYVRHYLRRLLGWRLGIDGHALWKMHFDKLAERNVAFVTGDFVDAAFDYFAAKLGMSQRWKGYPF